MNMLRSSRLFLDTLSLDSPSPSVKSGKLDDDDANEFTLHCMIVQTITMRLSWKRKLQFLTKLVRAITSLESLFLLIGSLKPPMDGKSWLYSELCWESNYRYDFVVRQDHCRAMDLPTFLEHEEDEVSWFSKLPFSQQLLVITNLLRVSGGSISRQIFRLLMKLIRERLQDPPVKEAVDVSAVPTSPQVKLPSRPVGESSETYQKLQEAKKQWKDKIDKYRKEVEGKPKLSKSVARVTEDKKTKKSDKSSMGKTKPKSIDAIRKPSKPKQVLKRSTDTSKKSRKLGTKSSSMTKTKGQTNKNESDYIMPIWTNMKIFNYLDDKTLRKVKQVNPYWAYVSDLVEQERKTRKMMNKVIKKMETELDKDINVDDEFEQFQKKYYNVTDREQKLYHMSKKGACDKRILGKGIASKNLDEWSLTIEALMTAREQMILPVHYLTTYPRLKKKEEQPPIYQFPFCCLRDINFTLDNTEEIVRDTYEVEAPSSIHTYAGSNHEEQMGNPFGCLLSDESTTSKSSFPYWETADLKTW